MQRSNTRILLAGHGVLTHALLQALLVNTKCEVAGVFLWSNRTEASVAAKHYDQASRQLARREGVTELRYKSINEHEFVTYLEKSKIDCVLIGSWGEKLTTALDIKDILVVNCHPSLLPKHRGANPYFTTILAGDIESGVSFHLVDEGYDTGPLILQNRLAVHETDTGYSLRQRCSELAASMVDQLVDILGDQASMEITAQENLEEPSYSRQVTQADALIDWRKDASEIHRQIRAVTPWRQPNFWVNRVTRLVISTAQTRSAKDNKTKRGTVMEINNDTIWINAGDQDIGFEQPRLAILGILLPWAWSKSLLRFMSPTGTLLPSTQEV